MEKVTNRTQSGSGNIFTGSAIVFCRWFAFLPISGDVPQFPIRCCELYEVVEGVKLSRTSCWWKEGKVDMETPNLIFLGLTSWTATVVKTGWWKVNVEVMKKMFFLFRLSESGITVHIMSRKKIDMKYCFEWKTFSWNMGVINMFLHFLNLNNLYQGVLYILKRDFYNNKY